MSRKLRMEDTLQWAYEVGMAHQRAMSIHTDDIRRLRLDLAQAHERLRVQDGELQKIRQMVTGDPTLRDHMKAAGYPGFTQ